MTSYLDDHRKRIFVPAVQFERSPQHITGCQHDGHGVLSKEAAAAQYAGLVARGLGVGAPFAEDEVHVLLFEPQSTVNTGNMRSERTRETESLQF